MFASSLRRKNNQMEFLKNLNNSFFIEILNSFFAKTQKSCNFWTKDSFFIQNIDVLINILVIFTFILSTFADSEKLGMVVLGSFGLLLIKYLFKQGSKVEIDLFDLFVIAYILIFTVATFMSSWFSDSLHGLFKMFVYFFGYVVFKDIFKTNPKYRIFYFALVAFLSSTEALIGIYQNIFRVESLATWQDMTNMNPEEIMTRVFGTLKPLNPNLFAGYLIATMPVTLGCAFYNFGKKALNAVFAVGLLATLLTIVFTGCRGSYVAVTVQMLAFTAISGHIIWHDFKDKKYLRKIYSGVIIGGIMLVLAAVLTQEALRSRICSIFAQRDDSSNSFRFNVYQSSLKMFKDNFLCGIGVGNWTFREVYGLYMRTGFDALGAYCVPLEIAVETGIVGLLNFLAFIGTVFVLTAKKICAKIPYNEKVILSAGFISILGMMAHGIVDTVWFRPQIQLVFWMIIAILGVTCNNADEVKE